MRMQQKLGKHDTVVIPYVRMRQVDRPISVNMNAIDRDESGLRPKSSNRTHNLIGHDRVTAIMR